MTLPPLLPEPAWKAEPVFYPTSPITTAAQGPMYPPMFTADQMRAYGEACAAAERERIAASFDIPLAIKGEAEEWCRAAARSIRARSGA